MRVSGSARQGPQVSGHGCGRRPGLYVGLVDYYQKRQAQTNCLVA